MRQRNSQQAAAWRSPIGRCRTCQRRRSAERLTVPEIAGKPDGRKIEIFAAVLPRQYGDAEGPTPLVVLAGGPGQAASTLAPVRLEARRASAHARRRAHRSTPAPAAARR
jgi:hypothetical protein